MSIQIFLQGRFQGVRELLASAHSAAPGAGAELVFQGRAWWVSLLSETLPRALLAELGLSKMLVGSSGGGQFLLVLPQEAAPQANAFLEASAAEVETLSGGTVRLTWAHTENLGDWAIVRRRMREAQLHRTSVDPPAEGAFAPFEPQAPADFTDYFRELGGALIDAKSAGWSPETPGRVLASGGKHVWGLGQDADQIAWTRHIALSDDGQHAAGASLLAARSEGARVWGVLRGDVDNLDVRFRRAQSVEEHIQLSVLYRQFFAGELEVLCSMPEFWRKVTILYYGGDDFAAYGSWDALILLARELQRLFRRFSEENLKDFPGAEGKTISMALALAREPGTSLVSVHEEAVTALEAAKCSARDSFSMLGRVLEWRQINGASDLKDTMVRIAREFGGSNRFLSELAAFYREEVFSPAGVSRRREGELEKPWRLHRRVLRELPPTRDRELEKLRNSLIVELVGKNASQIKLRPAGRVALEWARLLTEA
jgi:CRISPR-associated protein Csm1